MQFSLTHRTVDLSVGEFAGFSLGPQEGSSGPAGLWRAQLGQHWHLELQKRTRADHPAAVFEVPIAGELVHRGWKFALNGRIDQAVGSQLKEVKTVMHPLPVDEAQLRADYPSYFLQIAAYLVLRRTGAAAVASATPEGDGVAPLPLSGQLIFVETSSGLAQTVAITPFDEALVFHQLDAIAEFLDLQHRAAERRRALVFRPAFDRLRIGQETIQADLLSALAPSNRDEGRASSADTPRTASTPQRSSSLPSALLFEAPTGYGKTGCLLEFALGRLKAGQFSRLVWLTGKSTGQLQVMQTLATMKGVPLPTDSNAMRYSCSVAAWQVRNKAEHCVNHTFHCVRDGCDYLRDCAERWPGSGLNRFYVEEGAPRDLPALREAGRAAQICPYEITRAALPFNDVWIGDYNYLFAPDNRGLFFERPGFVPAETLVVIDEAHNLPSRVAGAYSHTADENAARLLLAALDHLDAPTTLVLAVEQWTRLLASLEPAESLDPDTEAEVRSLVRRAAELVTGTLLDYVALGPQHCATLWQFTALEGFLDDDTLVKLLWVARPGQLEFTCLDASAAIGATLRQLGGTILMSATLQPFDAFAASCGLENRPAAGVAEPAALSPLRAAKTSFAALTAPTPWRQGAYDVAVDLRVDTSFRQRANHHGTTAATVVALHAAAEAFAREATAPAVSAAIAVFFPSYAYAETIAKTLDDYGATLRVALQPKRGDLAEQLAWVDEHLVFSDALFLVLGSSFAEGIDLLGGRVTHAMVVGPALPEVNAVQKAKSAAVSELGREAAFRRVYQIPGLQKVNQALGRLVRAPGQRAKVLLHCRRFADLTYASLLARDYQLYREIADDASLQEWLSAK